MSNPRCLLLPSLLSANMMNLGFEIEQIIQAGADMLHLDVMDNHYVPNLTFGPLLCESIRQQFPTLPLDVHLMATPVDELITQYRELGVQRISIHPESTLHLDRSLQLIKDGGCEAGLVLNPSTPIDCIAWCVHRLDFVLIMTVNPGFGGQALIPEMVDKISCVRQQYPQLPICVDGGVSEKNILSLSNAGATQFVAGNAIFKSKDYTATMSHLRAKVQHEYPL